MKMSINQEPAAKVNAHIKATVRMYSRCCAAVPCYAPL